MQRFGEDSAELLVPEVMRSSFSSVTSHGTQTPAIAQNFQAATFGSILTGTRCCLRLARNCARLMRHSSPLTALMASPHLKLYWNPALESGGFTIWTRR